MRDGSGERHPEDFLGLGGMDTGDREDGRRKEHAVFNHFVWKSNKYENAKKNRVELMDGLLASFNYG
jgi:hypothetical protein